MQHPKNNLSQQSDAWAWQRTSSPRADLQLQRSNTLNGEGTPRCYMCGLKGQKHGTKDDDHQDQQHIRPQPNRCKSWCKFHMLKNPWSGHVTPLENYNPVWTGIQSSRPSSRPSSQRKVLGDIRTSKEEGNISGGSSSSSTPKSGKPKFYIFYDKELSHEKCNDKCKPDVANRRTLYEPSSTRDPRQGSQTTSKSQDPSSMHGFWARAPLTTSKTFRHSIQISKNVHAD